MDRHTWLVNTNFVEGESVFVVHRLGQEAIVCLRWAS